MWFKNKKMKEAVLKGNIERVQECLDAGVNVNFTWILGNFLFVACEANDEKMVKFLLENKANVNKSNHNPLNKACEIGNLNIVKILLDAGANINRLEYSISPVMWAASKGYVDIVKELIKLDARLDIQTEGGLDVFSVASTDEMKALLEPYKPKNTPRKFSYVKKSDREALFDENRAGWHMLSDDEIVHITVQKEITQEVREVFNFVSKQVITVVENTNTKTISQPLKESFKDYLDQNKLDKACKKQDKRQVLKAS